eukprot:GHVR01049409.1.p1 GENE.GHVR01049409.1~~GHVR01049409.1.p1  ORF type:complete len:135 (-),score=25.73 GHVR01049409.1:1631-2035(-)
MGQVQTHTFYLRCNQGWTRKLTVPLGPVKVDECFKDVCERMYNRIQWISGGAKFAQATGAQLSRLAIVLWREGHNLTSLYVDSSTMKLRDNAPPLGQPLSREFVKMLVIEENIAFNNSKAVTERGEQLKPVIFA